MKVLIAEDDAISRKLLAANLTREGYEVLAVEDGVRAWEAFQEPEAPRLAVLDWMMPGIDGAEVCRRVRAAEGRDYVYIILLTAKGRREDRAEGFGAGADEYLTKPFDGQELRARIAVGRRILDLQAELRDKVSQLEDALREVRQLRGLLPICMHCKKIRDEESTWHQLEAYIERRSDANFTHSICPVCMGRHYPEIQKRFAPKGE